jgi:hypothetical protein
MLAETLDALRPLLVDLLVTAAIALVGIVSAALVQLKGKGIAALGKLSDDRRWGAAIGKLDEATTAAVQAVEQAVIPILKASEPAGVLTMKQALEARDAAIAAAKLHLGPEVWREIVASLKLEPGEAEALLRTRIEAAVHKMRTQPRALELIGTEAIANGTPNAP